MAKYDNIQNKSATKTMKALKIISCVTFLVVLAASGYLYYLIFTNQFDVAYVASYSSRKLPTIYKISAFWAGQQGSFLLWLLIHAAVGAYIAVTNKMDAHGLTAYLVIEALLAVIVLMKSPFEPAAQVLHDGVGLNPLLQDPWMAIHPPIVFIGYALLAVPLSYSLGQLMDAPRNLDWLATARKAALIAFAFLGAGIFVGGYWAYKVLGWGGYWGWDPVENSSLVPWLLTAVLIHMLGLARHRCSVNLFAHLAAIFTYALVIYGTFLARSGVLGDFSVHSFSGSSIGLALAAIDGIILVASLIILTWRANVFPTNGYYESFKSVDFMTLFGMLLIAFVAVIVFIGMSMPLFTQLLEMPAAVDASFYVRTTLPLAIIIMALMVIATKMCLSKKFIGKGGLIVHVGVLIGFIAILISGYGGGTETQELTVGESVTMLGNDITYGGQRFSENGKSKSYDYTVNGTEAEAVTKLHANGEDAAREPAIIRTATGDIYIAPTPAKQERTEMIIKSGRVEMDEQFAYTYDGIDIKAKEGDDENVRMIVTASVSVTDGDIVETVRPSISVTADGGTSRPVPFAGGSRRMRLTGLADDERRIRVEVMPSEDEEAKAPVRATVSTKPMIWMLWCACAIVTVGSFIAACRE